MAEMNTLNQISTPLISDLCFRTLFDTKEVDGTYTITTDDFGCLLEGTGNTTLETITVPDPSKLSSVVIGALIYLYVNNSTVIINNISHPSTLQTPAENLHLQLVTDGVDWFGEYIEIASNPSAINETNTAMIGSVIKYPININDSLLINNGAYPCNGECPYTNDPDPTFTKYQELFDIIGNQFGGTSNKDFQVPNWNNEGIFERSSLPNETGWTNLQPDDVEPHTHPPGEPPGSKMGKYIWWIGGPGTMYIHSDGVRWLKSSVTGESEGLETRPINKSIKYAILYRSKNPAIPHTAGINTVNNIAPDANGNYSLLNDPYILSEINKLQVAIPERIQCFLKYGTIQDQYKICGKQATYTPMKNFLGLPISYTPTPGTTAIRIIAVGQAGFATYGNGGATVVGYAFGECLLKSWAISVGSQSVIKNNTPGAASFAKSTSGGPSFIANGGPATKYIGGNGVITSGYGMIFRGDGGLSGHGGNSGYNMANIGVSGMQNKRENFPGGASYSISSTYAYTNGYGVVIVEEFGKASGLGQAKIESINIKPDGKKYANIFQSNEIQYLVVGNFINYDPKEIGLENIYIECPLDCVAGWIYNKDFGFVAPPKGPLEYYIWDYSNQQWVPNESEKSGLISIIEESYESTLLSETITISYIPDSSSNAITKCYLVLDNVSIKYFFNVIGAKIESLNWLAYINDPTSFPDEPPITINIDLEDVTNIYQSATQKMADIVNNYNKTKLALYSMSMAELINVYTQLPEVSNHE